MKPIRQLPLQLFLISPPIFDKILPIKDLHNATPTRKIFRHKFQKPSHHSK